MINSVVLVGRLGNDPELSYSPSGTAIAKFRLGVTRPPRRAQDGSWGQEETDWLNIVCFGKTAENVSQYLDKGALVGVEGRVQSRTWERQDGGKAYAVEINAFRVHFLESRGEAEARRARAGSAGPQQRPQGGPPPQQEPPPPDEGWPGEEDEDPFGDQ